MDTRKLREGLDFYRTPRVAVIKLLENIEFSKKILEPACGDGAIAKILQERKYRVEATDIFDYGFCDRIENFLDRKKRADNIVTNPPFKLAEEFILKALDLANEKVAMLVRFNFLEGGSRYKTLYGKNPPNKVLLFSQRLTITPGYQVIKKGHNHIAYCWAVWDQSGTKTQLEWLPGKNSREVQT